MLFRLLQGQVGFAEFAFVLVALIIAITIHEFSHAWAANRLGDPTAKLQGRLTLNPASHLDPLGSVLILFTGFGWGRPVPVNTYQLKGGRRGMGWVSLAGPLSNFAMATLFGLAIRFGVIDGRSNLYILAAVMISLNVGLGLFNLLPFGPLDGQKIAAGFLPPKWAYRVAQINQSGQAMWLMLLAIFAFQPLYELVLALFLWLVVGS
jgi:Zn-dependent protease